MDKYFKPIGDLEETRKKDLSKTGTDYFHVASDLDDMSMGTKSTNGYFRAAGDLTPNSTAQGMTDYFKPAGDLNKETIIEKDFVKNEFNMMKNKEDINDYLLTVVSGQKYPSVCELGVLMEAGRIIIRMNELRKMVEEGYNIVSANVINADRGMIEVEFQRYVYDEELMEKRRRF